MMAVVLGVEFVLERRLRIDWRMGRTYAAVLPEPVFARAVIRCQHLVGHERTDSRT